jgi:hypothetical protein
LKKKVEAEPHRPDVPRKECHCEYCGDGPDEFQLIGSKTSTVYSMRPAKLIKRIYTRDTRAEIPNGDTFEHGSLLKRQHPSC